MYYFLKRTTEKQNHWHWFNRVNQPAATNLHNWICSYPGVLSVSVTGSPNISNYLILCKDSDSRQHLLNDLENNSDNITRKNYHNTAGTIDTYTLYDSETV